jgi:CRISPR/Cas system-associated exonuclease Cas4 (RecB family)
MILHKVYSIEEHVSSVLYGLHGYVDIIFEGQVMDIHQKPNDEIKTSKILFEIKTGKPMHKHKQQVIIYILLILGIHVPFELFRNREITR